MYPIEDETHEYDFVKIFFMGVNNPPKIDALKEFDLLAKELAKEVFYVITPKNDKYLDSIIMNEKYKSAWNYIKSYFKELSVNLIDLEYIFYNRNGDYFSDPVHLSKNGAKAFTKIIKGRLKRKLIPYLYRNIGLYLILPIYILLACFYKKKKNE